MHKSYDIPVGERVLKLGPKPVVMGIVNVTPDSFSDGGDNLAHKAALESARRMAAYGVDIIDIGGESTRPGAEDVSVQTELDRVIPAIEMIRATLPVATISIDTKKPLVAHQAVEAGADIINDVYGLQGEPEMAEIAAALDTPVIAMHWDRARDHDVDIMASITHYFRKTLYISEKAGISSNKVILDPGFGFAKDLRDNYEILHRLSELIDLDYPVLVGASRKSMIGKLLGNEPKERLSGTLAISVMAYQAGAHIFRVHDVLENSDALKVAQATLYGPETENQ